MQSNSRRAFTVSQNFFRSPSLVDRLLALSSIQPGHLVFDLGAGTGVITDRLARHGCRVVAVEKETALAASLEQRFAGAPAVRVCCADIRDITFPRRPYRIFANIPFNATAAVVDRISRARRLPEDAYLVVQREAAQRFIGSARATLVAVLLRPWFEAAIVHRFRPWDFTPAPRVEVVMLRLRKRGPPLVQPAEADLFRDVVVWLFTIGERPLQHRLNRLVGRRRAQRLASLLDLDARATPTDVSPEQWLELFAMLRDSTPLETLKLATGAERNLRRQQRRLRKVHRTRRSLKPARAQPVGRSGLATGRGRAAHVAAVRHSADG